MPLSELLSSSNKTIKRFTTCSSSKSLPKPSHLLPEPSWQATLSRSHCAETVLRRSQFAEPVLQRSHSAEPVLQRSHSVEPVLQRSHSAEPLLQRSHSAESHWQYYIYCMQCDENPLIYIFFSQPHFMVCISVRGWDI